MRRAQIQHAFTFIIVTIVITVTVILSIWLMSKLFSQSCDAEITKFGQDIEKLATQYDTVGTRLPITLPAACGAEYFCVFSQSTEKNDIETASIDVSPNILSLLGTAAMVTPPKNNVFLFKNNQPELEMVAPKLSAEPFCVPAQSGKFTFRVEGHGRTITLMPEP